MNYNDLFKNSLGEPAKEKLVIVGVNPLIEFLTTNPEFIADILNVNPKLQITIIYENNTENFNQSLFYDKDLSRSHIDFEKLTAWRNRLLGNEKSKGGLVDTVLSFFDKQDWENLRNRIVLLQNNLRHFANIVLVDDVIHYSFTTLEIPTTDMYLSITRKSNERLFEQLDNYIRFLLNKNSGGVYLSEPGDELIELYDRTNYPRGIYPRKAFYSTDFQRYSIWAFIFNRRGELLLHKRSQYTADNRSLWDKSAGGHVDLRDRSTVITAKREVVEELFMPEAEFTPYMTEKTRDFIDFGEWDVQKRPESYFKSDFDALDCSDWVIFRPVDRDDGYPMTIRRRSPRIMHIPDIDDSGKKIPLFDELGERVVNGKGKQMFKEHTEIRYTRFISDVYLLIAPDGYLDTEEQMQNLMQLGETKGAASGHRLISIDQLTEEIAKSPQQYTDDLAYMATEKCWLLTQFSEFVKYIFNK